VAAGLDASPDRGPEYTGGADYGKDSGWVFRRREAAILCMQREGNEKEESEAEKREGKFLH